MRKLFSLFAALTLSVGLWAETVNYLCPVYNDPQDVTKGIQKWETKTADATEITNASATLAAGWYVVKGYVQTGTLVCQGEVHLIVYDGAKLTATGADNKPGIEVAGEGNSLTIYGYTNQSGQLIATGGEEAAGIGGGKGGDGSNITINGGIVTATGGKYAAGIGGGGGGTGSYITINGGTITAISNVHGAGIGGGSGVKGSYITINGGTVTAICDSNYGGAGIGGGIGGDGFNITILAGTVTATGGEGSAGIGGGDGGAHGFNITISGGTVEATGGKYAAGIGGGGDGSEITISGGTVTATGGDMAAGIGSGYDSNYAAEKIFVATSLVVRAGDSPNPTDEIAKNRTATTDIANDLAGKQYAIVVPTTYTRDNLSNGKFGTICLAYAVDDLEGVGATFYKLNYFDESASALYFEEVDALAAGMPYIFEAKAESFTVNLTITDEPADAGNENGLYGTLDGATMTSDASHSYAAFSNNQVNVAENGNTVTVAANRAYIDMNEVATSEQSHSAPLRVMGVPRGQATNNENVNADGNMNGKFIINGQFVIVKDNKMYNAQGTLIN